MTTKPVATWILSLEQSAHIVEYLIIVWAGGKIEFEESYALDTWHRQEGLPIDARALFAHEFIVDDRENAEALCTYTRQIKLERGLLKQILRAQRRGIYRDNSKLPLNDPWRGHLDLLGTVIDKALEKIFWSTLVEFMVVRPVRRADPSAPQTRQPPLYSEISIPSRLPK